MAMFTLLDESATTRQIIDGHNAILKRDAGVANFGTRILWTDYDGNVLNRQTNAVTGTSEPTLTIENGAGEHLLIRKSTDSSTVFEVQDTGVTFLVLNPAGGALTIGGGVMAQGAFQADGDSTLGNSNTDTTTVRGVLKLTYTTTTGFVTLQATNSATPDLEVKRTDGTQLWRGLNAGGLIVGTASAMVGSELIRVQGAARIEGATTITTGGLTVTAGGLTVTAGGLTVTAGGLTVTAGGLVVSASGAAITGDSSVAGTFTVTESGGNALAIDANKNVVCGVSAPATTATDGFLYIPTCNGAPTGIATSKAGYVPVVWDASTNTLYIHIGGGTWRGEIFT